MQPIKLIYLTTILTICSLYAAQPIQPVFQDEFHLTGLQATLFTTLMLAPLGLAPLFYGYILESFPIKKVLRFAILSMGILEFIFILSTNYSQLLTIRALQGLVIPAILTSLMSYVSYTSSITKVQQNIALYIGATTVGGFLGRIISGVCTDFLGWQFFFGLLSLFFFCTFFLLNNLEDDVQPTFAKPSIRLVAELVSQPVYFWLYLCIFCVFFVFSAMMNFLPFRLLEINPEFGASGIGILYLGYAMGITVSVINKRIRDFFGNEIRATGAGILLFMTGNLFFLAEQYWLLFVGMFVFCAGMFAAHTLLSGYLSKLSENHKAIANGLYISFYYGGGTLGSFLPGFLLERVDWHWMILSLCLLLFFSLFCNHRLAKRVADNNSYINEAENQKYAG